MQRDATFRHLLAQRWQEGTGDALMHQQRFYRITGAWTLGFSVDDNLQRRFYLRGVIHHDMAYANTTGDHRNGRLLAAQLVQARTAAWDEHVDVFVHAQHLVNQSTVGAFNRLHGTRR